MSEHKIELNWLRATPDFAYDTYDRTHSIRFEGGITMQASSAPEFLGKAELVNPEEMLAAALASCHMLTFLAIAARKRLTVDSYKDNAVATLAKNTAGKMAVTKTVLHPVIKFSGEAPSPEEIAAIHQKAHENCFIANSVNFPVTVAASI